MLWTLTPAQGPPQPVPPPSSPSPYPVTASHHARAARLLGSATAALLLAACSATSADTSPPADRPVGRYSAVGALGPDGDSFFLAGGGSTEGALQDAWRLDLSSQTWQRLGDLPEPMLRGTATRSGRQILVFGGEDAQGTDSARLWSWNLDDDAWTLLDEGSGPAPRKKHGATLAGENLLISGGSHDDLSPAVIYSDSWIWNQAGWTQLASDGGQPGTYRQAMAWDAERQLVWSHAGYDADNTRTDTLWQADALQADATWQATPQPGATPPARASHTMVVVPTGTLSSSGSALVVWGGHATDTLTWVFDPDTGAWTRHAAGPETPLARDAQVADLSADSSTLYLLCGDPVSEDVANFVCDAWALDLSSMIWTQLVSLD